MNFVTQVHVHCVVPVHEEDCGGGAIASDTEHVPVCERNGSCRQTMTYLSRWTSRLCRPSRLLHLLTQVRPLSPPRNLLHSATFQHNCYFVISGAGKYLQVPSSSHSSVLPAVIVPRHSMPSPYHKHTCGSQIHEEIRCSSFLRMMSKVADI